MNRRVLISSLAACALLWALPLATASAAGGIASRTVRGTVVNASASPGRPVANLPVELRVQDGGRVVSTLHATTDRHGNFVLTALAADASATFTISTVYRDVSYSINAASGQMTRPLTLQVYDTTASDGGIGALKVIIGLRRTSAHALAVAEGWYLANLSTTPRSVIGQDAATGRGSVTIPLPSGATNVAVHRVPHDATITLGHGAVILNTVVRPLNTNDPGTVQYLAFSFDLPSPATHPTLVVPARYFIQSIVVWALGSHLQAPGFAKLHLPRVTSALQQATIAPGSTLAIGVDGPPAVQSTGPQATSAPASQPPPPAEFPTSAVIVMMEVGFAVLLVFALRSGISVATGKSGRLELQREQARLIGAIAELDLQHERGTIAESTYRERRAREKDRLLGVARRLSE